MHTARSLTVSRSIWQGGVPGRGRTCLGCVFTCPWGVYLPGVCTCLGGCTSQGVCVPAHGGCTCLGGVYLPRGCTCLGGYLPMGGVYLLQGVPGQGVYLMGGVPDRGSTCPCTPLWTEFLTHATKNITLPQLRCSGKNTSQDILRTVGNCCSQDKREVTFFCTSLQAT